MRRTASFDNILGSSFSHLTSGTFNCLNNQNLPAFMGVICNLIQLKDKYGENGIKNSDHRN